MPAPMENFKLWAAHYGGVDPEDDEAVDAFYERGIDELSDFEKIELANKLLNHELPLRKNLNDSGPLS